MQEFQDQEFSKLEQNFQKHVRVTQIFKDRAFELLESEQRDVQAIEKLKRIAYFFDVEDEDLAKHDRLADTQRIRQPQEKKGSYHFSGQFYVTSGIQGTLSTEEIRTIYEDVQQKVKEQDGIDYLMVYIHAETGQKLFFIDQLNKEMLASGDYAAEHNHCTLMLAQEY